MSESLQVDIVRDEVGSIKLYASPTSGDDLLDDGHPGPGWIRGIVHTSPRKYWFALPANRRMVEEMPEDVWAVRARSMAKSHFENELREL